MSELGLLYRYLPTELPPPIEVWEQIVQVLDTDKKRNPFELMDAFELPPPSAAWENIVTALDEQDKIATQNNTFAATCLAMEFPPPAFIWNGIEKALDVVPIKKISNKKVIRMITVGVAIAACITGIILSVFYNADKNIITGANKQVAAINKVDKKLPQDFGSLTPTNKNDSQHLQDAVVATNTNQNSNLTPIASDSQKMYERDFIFHKYKSIPVPDVITTTNKVATLTGKVRDTEGNIITRMSDYFTNGSFVAAIGPNGNSVNVSSKLIDMIPYFQEDSASHIPEEYLDKVIRESSIWRLKLLAWKKMVSDADANPSQMNFLDPIDLVRFLDMNK